MNEFLEQFLLEARELVEQATRELLALERNPQDRGTLDGAFRAFHTLKGGAGIVDFAAMSRAVHAAEDALAAVRSGTRPITTQLIGDCLACVDQVAQWLDEMQSTGDVPVAPDSAADRIVARLGYGKDPVRSDEALRPPEAGTAPDNAILSPTMRTILDEQLRVLRVETPDGREGRIASVGQVAVNILRSAGNEANVARIEQALAAIRKGSDVALLADALARALGVGNSDETLSEAYSLRGEAAETVLRIDARRLDALVNLVGEMIVAKNAIEHVARVADEGKNPLTNALKSESRRLERLTGDLRDAVLRMRVLPLRSVFHRFLRVVRELAIELEKPANLVITGEGTEVDKVIAEMLFEPLLHVIRNAMDHGIEPAGARAAAQKPTVATIRLQAAREGDRVVVEVVDDGRGIDLDRVRDIAIRRNLMSADEVAGLDDRALADLVFASGFSTARAVTGLSGRGVGMDAVRAAVERIGGTVSIESRSGQGCTVRFVLPFSVMTTQLMTVEAGGQVFGIPIDAVVETVRLPKAAISPIGTAAAFVLRDRTIPLVDLARILGRPAEQDLPPEVIAVVTSTAGQAGALRVDRLGGRLDVILKPVQGLLAGIPGIVGTTVTGDGQILLILDLQQLFS